MEEWLRQVFPTLKSTLMPPVGDALDAVAMTLSDFTDERAVFVGDDHTQWNFRPFRGRLPQLVGTSGHVRFVPLTVVVLGRALIAIWHDSDESALEAAVVIDGLARRRQYSPQISEPVYAVGSRYVETVLGSYRAVASDAAGLLDAWEADFVSTASADLGPDAFDPLGSIGVLGVLRATATALQRGLDEMSGSPGRPAEFGWWSATDHTRSRIESEDINAALSLSRAEVGRLRTDVSDAFLTASTVAIATQVRLANLAQDRVGRLQRAVTLLTAFLLVPSLVAAIFGTNVALPGRTPHDRAVIMYITMAVAAGATFILLTLVERSRRRA